MARKRRRQHGYALPGWVVTERMNHRASGAAGVHSDQLARRSGALAGNRQRTRSARRRAAIADQD